MNHSVGLESTQRRFSALEERSEAWGGGEAPDRRKVGAGGSKKVESIAFGLRSGELVRKNLAFAGTGEFHGADDSSGVPNNAVLVGGIHSIHRVGGLRVVNEHAFRTPLHELLCGIVVGVLAIDR